MARPQLEIDPEEVRKLAELHCTNEEIAYVLGCSVDTIERRFAGELIQGRNNFKVKLRRLQLKACEKGNPQLLIWLGKNYLEQKDKREYEVTSEDATKQIDELKEKLKVLLAP